MHLWLKITFCYAFVLFSIFVMFTEHVCAAVPRIFCTPPGVHFIDESITKFTGREYPRAIKVRGLHNKRITHYFADGQSEMFVHSGPLNIFDKKIMKKAFPKVNGKLPQHDIAEFVVGVVINSRIPVKSLTVEEFGKRIKRGQVSLFLTY